MIHWKVGDKPWLVNRHAPTQVEIVGIMGGDVDLAFDDGTCRYGSIKELHLSREELIDSQIEYWRKLKDFQGKPCDHEHDGILYTSNPPKLRCKKCGVFYK